MEELLQNFLIRRFRWFLQEFSNNTDWIYSEPFANAPRCAEIIAVATGQVVDDDNLTSILEGEKRYCLDFNFKVRGLDRLDIIISNITL